MDSKNKLLLFKFIFFVSFIFYFILIKLTVHSEEVNSETIRDFKLKLYPYSGFNEEAYIKFVNNIDLFGKNIREVDISSSFLYTAIDNAHDLLFYSNYDFTDDVKEIAIEGENLLLQSSLKYKTLFIPKYLNRTTV